MQVDYTEFEGYAVIKIAGDLIEKAHEETERLINECLRKKIGIILDFSELSYISSVGIGTLVRAYKIAKKDGLKIVIVRPPEPVMGIIRTVEIDRLHLIASTREEAEKIIKETAE